MSLKTTNAKVYGLGCDDMANWQIIREIAVCCGKIDNLKETESKKLKSLIQNNCKWMEIDMLTKLYPKLLQNGKLVEDFNEYLSNANFEKVNLCL